VTDVFDPPWGRANRVVVDGSSPTPAEVARIREGADVDVMVAPTGGLRFLDGFASAVRSLWIADSGVRDLSPLAGLTGLRSLRVETRTRAPEVDLSKLPALESVSLGSKEAWRAAGSAISAPKAHDIGVWHPEAVLFETHPTRADSLRLVSCRALTGLPPLSNPRLLRSLWIQEIPELDLAGITRFARLEQLHIEHARRVVGFGALRELLRLRTLAIGAVASIDEPAALGDLKLHRFSEWATNSQDRVWWLPDLDALQARGVDAVDPEWRVVRAAYETRWAARTGKHVPRYFG
jgi:hypothetical protein